MKVRIVIENDEASDSGVSMGISAAGVEPFDVFKLLLAGAEMMVYQGVVLDLVGNGASLEEAEFAGPLRTRLLALEQMINQELQPYQWVSIDTGADSGT
jgi:hypothetical protein